MKDFVDDLYRRASEDPDIPFNEEAWNRMDQKLDYVARKRRRGLIWLFLLLFVSLGAGLLWGIQRVGTFDQKIKKEKYTGPVAGNAKPGQQHKTKSKQDLPLNPSGQNQEKGSNSELAAAKDQQEKGDVNKTGNQTTFLKTTPRFFTSEQQGSRQRAKTSPGNQAKVEAQFNQNKSKFVEDLVVVLPQVAENGAIGDTALGNTQSGFVHFDLEPLLGSRALKEVKAEQIIRIGQKEFLCSLTIPDPIASTQAKSWGLGLSAGPDLASVNANGSTAYGLNAGLAFDYRIGKRWVFLGSGQYLLKNYIADQREYVAPSGFWPTRSYPKSTEGTCDMLQWSVDLRYNWLAKPKFQSFVSIGSSSWTILKEEYEFYYAKDYPGLIYDWSSGQNKNYWFSMAQMGIGIEKTIRPGLSLQLNWFAQMPLKGVGNGKVEIYSSGLGFMVHKQMGKLKK